MKSLLKVVIVLVFIFLAVKPLFAPGFFPIHDNTQVSRVFEMGKSLGDGIFPARWVRDLGYGYGYPIFNFYAPLPYYAGGFLVLLGFNALFAAKAIIFIPVLLSFIFMFMLGKNLWGAWGGLISAVLYTYSPYHAVQIYVRGDFAELWAYSFIPLLFYGFLRFHQIRQLKYLFLSSVAFALIILSHNLTAFMSLFFIIPFILYLSFFSKNKLKSSGLFILSMVLGILISSFYVFPAIFEMKYTNVFSQIGGGADFRNHFVCLPQLWESSWGFGGSAPGCADGLSFRLGKLHLLLVFLFLIFLGLGKFKEKKLSIFLLLLFLLSIFFMLPVSKFFWSLIPQMSFIQYPWRFLIFASFFSSLLLGSVIYLLKQREVGFGLVIIIVALSLYAKLFSPQTVLLKTSEDYTRKDVLNYKISKISDEFMPPDFDKPKNLSEVPNRLFKVLGKGEIKIVDRKTNEVKALANLPPNSLIHANIAYFPAWRVFVNNSSEQIKSTKNGFDFIVRPQGESRITLKFSETPIEKWSNILSLAGVLVLILGTIRGGYAKS